ncbi:thioesterase family protein [Rhabdothermincola salaria]|uniref:thioesterase family protein n=1 Tax=Rhabdothermincola salaria TaxID=2903142 RepID=UPI001E5655DD|nr:hotdog domain-containing protein [Rhabdothermincola salaria]MCD9623789.1 thioesterase [Rhabdothermincola salaria]
MPVEAGQCAAVTLLVGDGDTAIALRSGEVPVLATPRLIGLCEEAAVNAVAGHLKAGETTVSMKVQIDHLQPSAVGHEVTAEATVDKVAGRRVSFTVSVNDERGLVAAGRVTRVVVDAEQFLTKCS